VTQIERELKEITRSSAENETISTVYASAEIVYYNKDLWGELILRNIGWGRGSEGNCFISKGTRDSLL
jgi:hypothetical protein